MHDIVPECTLRRHKQIRNYIPPLLPVSQTITSKTAQNTHNKVSKDTSNSYNLENKRNSFFPIFAVNNLTVAKIYIIFDSFLS